MNLETNLAETFYHQEAQSAQSPEPIHHSPGPAPACPQPVDGKELLDSLVVTLKRFVILPNWAAESLALWVLHTYAFHLRDVTTYLGVESPEKRCGKTTLLALLSKLVNRPVAAANISSPAFFRVIQETQPTLLIDEADTFLQSNDELRGILNAGYTRDTAFVLRVGLLSPERATTNSADDHQSRPRESSPSPPLEERAGERRQLFPSTPRTAPLARFSCWCPKVLATIGRLPDTLADRCILIRMQRKTLHEPCERLRVLDPTPFNEKCARFVAEHADEIASARPEIPPSLNDRAADIWEPLLVLADLAGGHWPELSRQAAEALSTPQESNPLGSLLLDIMVYYFGVKADRLFTRDLVAMLNQKLDRPWAENLHGKPITDIWLAKKLRPFGVRPKTIWIGEEHAKGYLQADLMEIFLRYIPAPNSNCSTPNTQPNPKPKSNKPKRTPTVPTLPP